MPTPPGRRAHPRGVLAVLRNATAGEMVEAGVLEDGGSGSGQADTMLTCHSADRPQERNQREHVSPGQR